MRTLLILLSLGASACDKLPVGRQNSAPPTGRWTIIHSPHVVRDTMLIDTATGKTWQLVKLGEKEDSGVGWQHVKKLDGQTADEWFQEAEATLPAKS